jgi:glucosamine-6-phosphate deaminase
MKLVRVPRLEAWADHVASELVRRLQVRPDLRICLPTGSTPVPVYDRIAAAVARREVSFSRAAVFLLDEFGGVSKDDPGRCDQMLRRWLLDRIDLPVAQYHRFDLDGDIDAECARFEALLDPEGCDLTLLGIGGNGHIGMNEPGSAADTVTRRVALAPATIAASARYFGRTSNLPSWGVTLGVGTIRRSEEVWLIATGTAKAHIVRATLRGPLTTAVPASLLQDHPNTVLMADDDAAALA